MAVSEAPITKSSEPKKRKREGEEKMRRRLRLRSSSDEDEDSQPPISSNSNSNPNPNPNPPENPTPVEIPGDDDDVVDIPESPTPSLIPPTSASSESSCPIDEFLTSLGVRLQRQWLDSCISGLSSSRPGFAALNVAGKAKLCFEQFLTSDMNACGRGVLPDNVHSMHAVELAGPFVLQVDEVVNIGLPLRDRYHDAPASCKRCLKLSMTDGAQRVFGMEYRPICALEVLAPAGFKISIRNVHIKRGLLMLVPEVLEVLGGVVEDLDAARQRLVQEVNKPPRGKRQRNGEAPSLATRARVAAWPPNIVNDDVLENLSRSEGPNPYQSSVQVSTLATSSSNNDGQASGIAAYGSMRVTETRSSFLNGPLDEPTFTAYGSNSSGRIGESFATPSSRQNAELNSSFSNNASESSAAPSSDNRGRFREGFSALGNVPDAEANSTIPSTVARVCTSAASCSGFRQRTAEEPAASTITVEDAGNPSFLETTSNISKIAGFRNDRGGRTSERVQSTRTSPVAETSTYSNGILNVGTSEGMQSTKASPNAKASPSSNSILNVVSLAPSSSQAGSAKVAETFGCRPLSEANKSSISEEICKVGEVGQPLILSGEKELPFTYLACLLAKWTAKKDTIPFVHGKIKCFLTGVKRFQFKKRSTYELQVYVDDGSLISEVLIDHNVVQKGIGYSPEEVTAALSSTDKKTVTSVKETVKKFQLYLANFEGTMLMEINRQSPLPVALEMDQGCLSSDAWLLLRRLRVFTAQSSNPHQFDHIDISP